MTGTKSFVWIAIVLLGLLPHGTSGAMSSLFGKPPLASPWKERFQDVKMLNDFAKAHPVELSGVVIEKEKIDNAVLNGGQFRDTDWKLVSVKAARLTKTVFRQSTLDQVDFSDSILTDVVFEDVVLREVRFFRATLNNVRFVRCTFNGSNLDKTKASRIEVDHSTAINTSFSEGELVAVFRNSKLINGTELTDLRLPSALTFEKSDLDGVDLSRSKLSELVLDEATSRKSGIRNGEVAKATITGGEVAFSFSESQLMNLVVQRVRNVELSLVIATVHNMTVNDCLGMQRLNLYQAKIGTLSVTNCSMNNFDPIEATVQSLFVEKSLIADSDLSDMKAKNVWFAGVSLDRKVDFTNAHVEQLNVKNLTKLPQLKLITTGSNVKF